MLEEEEESKGADDWNQGFDDLAFRTGQIEPDDNLPIKKRPTQRTTMFDPADW